MQEPQHWRIQSSRYVINRPPYFVLREDTVILPNGKTIPDYFVLEYPDWVIVLAITTRQEFVLIRQYRHGIGKVQYELAAGIPEDKEHLLESAQREFLEETGYGGGAWQLWMQTAANSASHTNTAHVFLAVGVEPVSQQDLDDTEEISVHLVSKNELRNLLETNQIFQAMHAAALWKYLALEPEMAG